MALNQQQYESAEQDPAILRQWRLIGLLRHSASGLTVKQLMAELAVSIKTVRRDLIDLSEAGFPLEERVEDHGRKTWRIDPKRGIPNLCFTFEEALALYLGCRLLEPLAGTLVATASQSALRKIRASLPDQTLRYLDRIAGSIHLTTVGGSYTRHGEILDQLLRGIEDHRVVFIAYRSQRSTEPVTYDVHPYGLALHKTSLYLIGFAPGHNAIRHWKINRIEHAEVDPMPFQMPADFDLRHHLCGSFGIFQGDSDLLLRIRFSPTVARYVQETTWHASQTLHPEPTGALLATFHLSTTTEIKQWLLSFGQHAEILEPQSLRDEIRTEAEAMAAIYKAARQPRRARSSPQSNPKST